ncbi:low molecular weight phosphatase family protein [Candidatus Woesearchaeota archaeon]|nr:low molecular weight phosphatase family protein [Candidatus Woesearchaeota archaeon]
MSKTILFVCHGNSIRSIMAESIFNKFAPKGYRATSAGTLPIHTVDPNAVEVLKQIKVKVTKKAPTHLEFDELDSAHKIVKMNKHLPNFPSMIPKGKIIEWQTPDVVGHPIEDFRKTRDFILKQVKALVKKLS